MKLKELTSGQQISLYIGGCVAPGAVFVQMLHGQITKTTEKAVQITCTDTRSDAINGRAVWFPKKAIQTGKDGMPKLARWYTATGYTAWYLDNVNVSGVSA